MKNTILISINLFIFIVFINCSNIDHKVEMMKDKNINKSSDQKISLTSNEMPIKSFNEADDSLPLIVGKLEAKLDILNKNLNDMNKNISKVDNRLWCIGSILCSIYCYLHK